MPNPSFLGKRLLFITAHPDDESYAVAGTILKNCECAGQSFLICATLGERGKSHLKSKVDPSALKKIRNKELHKVSTFLKVDKLWCLNFPDTQLDQHPKELAQKIQVIVAKLKPDFILSFGQDGLSGHTDHITVGLISHKIARKFKVPFIKFCAPPSFYDYIGRVNQRRKFGKYIKQIPKPTTNVKVKINSKKKLKALTLHKSQLDADNPFTHMPMKVAADLLSYEYFQVME